MDIICNYALVSQLMLLLLLIMLMRVCLADFDNNQTPVINAITTYTTDFDPDIVKFTFSLNNQSLTKGDVIVFRITTDYGDYESGFFTDYGVTNGEYGPTWELNKDLHNDYSFIHLVRTEW